MHRYFITTGNISVNQFSTSPLWALISLAVDLLPHKETAKHTETSLKMHYFHKLDTIRLHIQSLLWYLLHKKALFIIHIEIPRKNRGKRVKMWQQNSIYIKKHVQGQVHLTSAELHKTMLCCHFLWSLALVSNCHSSNSHQHLIHSFSHTVICVWFKFKVWDGSWINTIVKHLSQRGVQLDNTLVFGNRCFRSGSCENWHHKRDL